MNNFSRVHHCFIDLIVVMHMIRIGNGYKVEWHDINDIKLVNDSAGSRIAQKIGIGGM